MVKIAIAGGSGQVAREVIDVLSATCKHEITILSRNNPDPGKEHSSSNIAWRTVDYGSKNSLADALRGVHTVLSFIQLLSDPGNQSQKNLIDACVIAGVKRFAPSEWGSAGLDDMPWWAGKKEVRQFCEQLNAKEKVLEYTLFQPGLFLEYLASPYQTAKHLSPLDTMFDFHNRRAIVVEGHEDAVLTLTTVQDLARTVAEAVEYEGVWPVHGGIQGNRLTASEILSIGERVRGQPFAVERVKLEDLEQGKLNTSWVIAKRHAAVKEEEAEALARVVLAGLLLTSANGAWDVSDAFNRLLPEYTFTKAEDFLASVWLGKP